MQMIAYRRQHAVPCTSAQCGVEQEAPEVHLCQSCRHGDKLSYHRHETSCQRCHHAMFVKVTLRPLYLFLVEQAHLPPTAVGEAVYDRSAEVVRGNIIDYSAAVRSECGEENHEPHIKHTCRSLISRRGDEYFRRHWYHGAFQKHPDKDFKVSDVG